MKLHPLPILHRLLHAASLLTVIAILAYLGHLLIQEKIEIVKPLQFIGHADEAAYVSMGQSLSEGRGLLVNYVSWHFISYPDSITRREDHWPPFMGFAIAPCFSYFGKAPWVAKLPAIAFGSLGLPLATALLTYALCRRGYAAILAGLLLLTFPTLYTESLKTLSDIATAMLVTSFAAALVASARHPSLHLAAGLFAALSFYAKGSELILLPLYPLMTLLIAGPRAFLTRWPYLGLITASLLIAPFLFDNYTRYHKPLHSTQNFVSGYMGLEDWEVGTYTPYWNGTLHPIPKTSDRWNKYTDKYPAETAYNREKIARFAILPQFSEPSLWADFGSYGYRTRNLLLHDFAPANLRKSPRAQRQLERELAAPPLPLKDWTSPPAQLAAISALAFVTLALALWPFAFLLTALKRRFDKRKHLLAFEQTPTSTDSPPQVPPSSHPLPRAHRHPLYHYVGPPLALALLFTTHAAFLAYLWEAQPRFAFVLPPILFALGFAFAALLLELPLRLLTQSALSLWKKSKILPALLPYARLLKHAHLVITLLLAFFLYKNADTLLARKSLPLPAPLSTNPVASTLFNLAKPARNFGYPYTDQLTQVTAGTWIGKNLPHAVIMTRYPWQLLFYAAPTNKAVTPPLGTAEEIFAIARYYHVTHLLLDCDRPSLYPYLNGQKPGLKRLKNSPLDLYELDYSQLPSLPLAPAPKPIDN